MSCEDGSGRIACEFERDDGGVRNTTDLCALCDRRKVMRDRSKGKGVKLHCG